MYPKNAGRVSLAVLVLALTASVGTATDGPRFKQVRIAGRFSAGAVERALVGARRRLEKPACQRLFSEFSDTRGRPLVEALEAKGRSGEEHLGDIIFYDGTSERQCERAATLAFTWPGSPIVFVCAQQFMKASRRSQFLVEAALIHEGLHTLGLGENPPTSAAITSRVLQRCGG